MAAWLKSALAGIDREAWIRFFVAVGGLVIAFELALVSTAARQAGDLWGTLILASLSLILAVVVGVTTVPYLARRVAAARVRDAFDFDVTREGAFYLGLVLVIGIAALNTGNNLLFIIVSALLAAILVSGIASALMVRDLELDVGLPEHVFAEQDVLGRVTLRNPSPFLPAFSVSLVRPKDRHHERGWKWEHSVFAFPPGRAPGKEWLRLPDIALRRRSPVPARPPIFSGSVYFPYVPAKTPVSCDVDLRFPRRGRYVQDHFGLATRFPFSFLVKTRRVVWVKEIVVFPSVEPTDEFFEVLPMITGEFETFIRGRGNDLYRIREYMPEDSARHVDWKASARTGALKVREFTREDERKLRIVFDNPWPGAVDENGYESGIALAASLAWHFAGESTDLSFAATGYAGSQDAYEFLRYLALAEPEQSESILEKLPVTDDYNVILTTRARGSLPTNLWSSSYFIFLQDAGSR